ncbi:TetR/AcrR family transcriptional regulator [Leisingera sp. HS039]|uniref:TetR/AcrR family transcriptional regulator n=1 Tax=unclassified Leisingera TaxID=2614906 RepID=UPI001070CDD8|nr:MULTISPECIES: TetR/AcrR family transcriptional regulator [unclassified Leisingera]MBQ4826316.1 TetR/AcrR family transcriptional regulator [Leisingera sp. HS039]QBR37847.1 TetR/AcrR family transcriptional regulator [Leisingera sp. NJS201]
MKFDRASAPRSQILKATKSLLQKGGVSAVSMRSVAGVIGVSQMMPYKHFPSKDHILMELRLEAFEGLTKQMRKAQGTTEDPYDALVQVSRAYVLFGLAHPNEYRLMFDPWEFDAYERILSDFGESANRESLSWQVNLDVVSAFCAAENLPVSPNAAAHWLWSSLHGALQLHLSRKLVFNIDIQELADIICRSAPASIRAMQLD